ncbi:MAG: two-component sensor histidine kinase [Anaerolinea sp.]|nr:two-component sensor histidine kinase [Anaerolinea sp.]
MNVAALRGPVAVAWMSVAGATLSAVAAIRVLLDAPAFDLAVVGAGLAVTGGAGASIALCAPRWASNLPLRWQLTLFSVIGLGGLLLNVAVAASLMFLSPHDLKLLLVLCVFALAGTIGPAQLMSRTVSRRVEALEATTAGIAAGDLAARARVDGADEVARLATSLNTMAASLQTTRRQRDDLEQARRDLFAAISHDLRTPLATMRVMVEAISDGVVTDSTTRDRYFASISGEIQRLSALIDDLFEITTLDSGALHLRLETLRVEDVVAEAIDMFRPQVEKAGIHLAFEPSPGTTPVQADAQRLARVLYNLLQNAIRHTPSDGTIVLRTAPLGAAIQVAVCDSGEGIASEDAPFVFDRFYRGDKARSRDGAGSGLGLAIARGIIEAHGGRIWVEPADGHGATVAFTLPAIA